MDKNKIMNISTEYPPSDHGQAISWSQALTLVRTAATHFFFKQEIQWWVI